MVSQSIPRTRAGDTRSNLVAGQLLAGQLAVIGCSLLINVLSARTMGPEGRGQLALLLQVSYIAGLVGVFGVDRCYTALVQPPNPTPRRAVRDLARLVTWPTFTVAVIVVAVGPFIGGGAAGLAMALVAAGGVCMAIVRQAAAASGKGRIYLYPTVLCQLTLLSLAVILTLTDAESVGSWIGVYGIAMLALPAVAWLLLRPTPPHTYVSRIATSTNLRDITKAGLRVLPSTTAAMVMLRSDRLLLPILGTYTQLGWYIIIATLTEAISWPVVSYVDARVPRWREAAQAGTLKPVRILGLVAAYGATAVLLTTAAGYLLIVPIFGEPFRESLPLLAPLSAAVAIYGLSRAAIGLDLAAGRLRTAIWTDLPAVIVALTAYTLLIPRLGAMGAAWGSLIGYTTATAVAVTLALRPATAATAKIHMKRVS